ncbi:unnamed protein product [Symbiodinium sp. CCMP2592]|nr:unnamed protein product [Symbiodinium sp. CCMP2592]
MLLLLQSGRPSTCVPKGFCQSPFAGGASCSCDVLAASALLRARRLRSALACTGTSQNDSLDGALRPSAAGAGHEAKVKICICRTDWKLGEMHRRSSSCLVRQILPDHLALCGLTVLLWRAWRLLLPDGSCDTFITRVTVACSPASEAAFGLQRCSCRVSAAGHALPSLQLDGGFQLESCHVLPRRKTRAESPAPTWCFAEVQAAIAEPVRSIRSRPFHSKTCLPPRNSVRGGAQETDADLKRLRRPHVSGISESPHR